MVFWPGKFLCYISNALIFIKTGLKLSNFSKKKKIQHFRGLGAPPQSPQTAPQFQYSGYTPESNHVFALLISMPPEFSVMPRLKSINFYQNKPKIKLFLQKNKLFRVLGAVPPGPQWLPAELPDPRTQPLPQCRFLVAHPNTKSVLLIFPSFRTLQWAVVELTK